MIVGLPQTAFGQQREILDLFDGIIRSGVAAATRSAWEGLPGSEVACLDGVLRQGGSSVNAMIRQGVSPSDPRISQFRSQCRGQTNASGPSFNCDKARYADEIIICGDAELARLDRLIARAYQDLLAQSGEGIARAVASPLLADRRACGADASCIRNAQLSAIRQFQQRGASIGDVDTLLAAPVARSAMAESIYVVDGLHLGGRVSVGSPSYLEYRCNPSDQFAGLTWCQRRRQESSPRGAYVSSTTILHSEDGTALYVNRFLEPAFFAGTEAMDDVRRLSMKYGEPRFIATPASAVGPRTLMATWGDVSLQPLDRARLADLAAGRDVRAGILVDHIGNYQRSASIGLPVYRVTGGAGYVWAASWDPAGRGTLRFLTIDPSRLAPGALGGAQEVAANPAPPQLLPTTAESSNAGPAPVASPSAASPPAAQPASQPSLPPTVAVSPPAAPEHLAPPESSKSETSAKPAEPAPAPPTARAQVSPIPQPIVADAVRPAAVTPPAVAPPADPASKAPPTPSASEPVEPRVVGPPIAIQAAAKTSETNYLQWALVAAVLGLMAAVGFLLFDRRKKIKPTSSLAPAPVPVPKDVETVEPPSIAPSEDKALQGDPERAPPTMSEPTLLPMALPVAAAMEETWDASANALAPALQGSEIRRSLNLTEHRHFGIGLLAALVAISAFMSLAIGPVGIVPLALAAYLLPTIIAFKVRHHYAWALAILNVVFGFTVLGWLGFFVWALIGPRKSALDSMPQHSALGLAKSSVGDPALTMSDYDLRSGWKVPVLQAEIFSFEGDGAPVESAESIKVFFKNPVIGIWRNGAASSGSDSVRYNAATQIRCVTKIAAETKLRVGRTLGRTALTGIGAAILTGRQNALGAAFLDYRFGGDETDEMVAALIVFSDYSSIVLQSESNEFEKLCALLPPHLLSDEVQAQTAEQIDRIKRMAADGPRVVEEMRTEIAETERSVAAFAEQAESGETFAERDEGRIGLSQAEERLIDERAVLNAVDRLIRLTTNRAPSGRLSA
ncbi:superinfection immunity protein [Bradyrhizobium sp. WU425]|uniref:superinfection immunity protein n=1 Tax=Bradyrhizobium sp. WU425 TaxID=187029 RepID=UPI001E61DAE2|nr:superinfection immunity protein [Bradyrhizobium canariense]UFW72885.1 superinfection immunity protein [Bradyrhizobium canariense]